MRQSQIAELVAEATKRVHDELGHKRGIEYTPNLNPTIFEIVDRHSKEVGINTNQILRVLGYDPMEISRFVSNMAKKVEIMPVKVKAKTKWEKLWDSIS